MRDERNKVWIHSVQTKLFLRVGGYWLLSQVGLWNLVFVWRLLQEGPGNPLDQYGRVLADFAPVLGRLIAREPLDAEGARHAFDAIFAGAWTPVQIGAFLVALRMTGETADAIVGAAGAMRAAMSAVKHEFPVVVDTCGTGGDGS